jgi:hypothetical protein
MFSKFFFPIRFFLEFFKWYLLYILIANCRWSEQSTSDNQKNHRQLKDGEDDNSAASKCGQEGGDNSNSWYVGMGKCMGSNVAYALYGVLASDSKVWGNPCTQKTFINSFFTTDGLTSFAQASNGDIDASSINQQCQWYDNNKKYSTTLGCSATGSFTKDTFLGSGCFGYNYNGSVDDFDELNQSLQNMKCTLIYSSDGSVNYATSLLSYSQVCTVDGLNKKYCPNPYKMVSTYEYNFAMAQQNPSYRVSKSSLAYTTPIEPVKVASSFVLFAVGLALFASSAWQVISLNRYKKRYGDNGAKSTGLLA